MDTKPDDYDPGVKVDTKRTWWNGELGNVDIIKLSVKKIGDRRNTWVSNPHGMTAEQAREVAQELLDAADKVEKRSKE